MNPPEVSEEKLLRKMHLKDLLGDWPEAKIEYVTKDGCRWPIIYCGVFDHDPVPTAPQPEASFRGQKIWYSRFRDTFVFDPEDALPEEIPKKEKPRKQKVKRPLKCFVSTCFESLDLDPHHIVYWPCCIVRLCRKHHKEITVCNINACEKTGRKLTNLQRWTVWEDWLAGRIVPEMTAMAERWLAGWK